MSQKRSRWIVNLVLVLALLAFVGLFTLPLLESVIKESQPSVAATPASTQAPSSTKFADLGVQAKGYEQVLQREPESRTALRGLLDVRLQLGDLKGAIEILDKLARLNPEQTDYMVLLAQAKQQLGDREGAAQAYRLVLGLKPGDMNALQGLVGLQLQEKRPEAAIGLLQETLKTATQANQTQPGSIDTTSVQLLLGQVYVSQQRNTEATTIYDDAIKANKQDFRPVLAKALVLQQSGRIAEAKPLFTTATLLAPAQYKDQIKQMAADTQASATPVPAATPIPNTSPSSSSTTQSITPPVPTASPK